jgi:hypothetical protein
MKAGKGRRGEGRGSRRRKKKKWKRVEKKTI